MLKLILIFFLLLTLSCSSKQEEKINYYDDLYNTNTLNDSELFENANELIKLNQFELALIELDKLEVLFPNSNLSKKGMLTTAYIFFLQEEYEKARAISENYKKYFPGSVDIAYANYLDAMTYFILIKKTNFSQKSAIIALEKFNFILNAYPNSSYEIDIITKVQIIQNNLADHKLITAKYYIGKNNNEAALIYLKDIFNNYSNSSSIEETLYLISKIYFSINEEKLAKKYASILAYNFPESSWYDKTYKILNEIEINEIEDKWYEKYNPIKILKRNEKEIYNSTEIQAIE